MCLISWTLQSGSEQELSLDWSIAILQYVLARLFNLANASINQANIARYLYYRCHPCGLSLS
jgi:hypothetical protein